MSHHLSSVNGKGTSHNDPLSRILDELSSLKLWKEKLERKEKGKERVKQSVWPHRIEKERKTHEANINLPYFHGKDNVTTYLDWKIRVKQQLKRKSTLKSYGSHSYPKKDQGLGILGAPPSKPKDDKGKTIEKQPP